jgi:protein-S-isoprenylcysteine O-methyltransferase Ste14
MGRNRTGRILNKIAKKRTTFNGLFFMLILILGKGLLCYILAGIPFILAGIFLRIIAAGTIKKNQVLTNTGPYKICRHPLYLGSFLISTGFVIFSHNIFILLYFLIFFPLMYIPTILSEERFLTDKFGKSYLEYKKQTPLFVPKLRKLSLSDFSWVRVKTNKEYINWLIFLILILSVLIKSYLIFDN